MNITADSVLYVLSTHLKAPVGTEHFLFRGSEAAVRQDRILCCGFMIHHGISCCLEVSVFLSVALMFVDCERFRGVFVIFSTPKQEPEFVCIFACELIYLSY